MARNKKEDPARRAKNDELKKAIGERFKKFRKSIDKAQHQLASELSVFQSTITNFELGKTFPNFSYLHQFYENYGLNIHWLFTGEGNKFVHELPGRADLSYILEAGLKYESNRHDNYVDLLKHMQIPEIEKILFAKLVELKEIYKERIAEFTFAELDLEKPEKPEKKKKKRKT
jgi:transcriptional regulator with XRE-family HTH domain